MEIVALLTGRGNNTLRDKNVIPVCGKPLLAYPALAARRSKHITRFYVSSEDEKILSAAADVGYERIVRPPELAAPTAQHGAVVLHALEVIGAAGVKPEILVVLLANSATIKTEWIDGCIEMVLEDDEVSAAVPVRFDLDHHPYRAKRVNAAGFLDPFFDFSGRSVSMNRQDLEPSCFLCHNFWVLNVRLSLYAEGGQPPWSFMGARVRPFVVDECFDVHDYEDVEKTEKWLVRMSLAEEGVDSRA